MKALFVGAIVILIILCNSVIVYADQVDELTKIVVKMDQKLDAQGQKIATQDNNIATLQNKVDNIEMPAPVVHTTVTGGTKDVTARLANWRLTAAIFLAGGDDLATAKAKATR